jgi:NADH-quinone oxidoreductase subunit H
MTQFWTSVIVALVMANVILVCVAYGVFLERKIAAWVQDRHGPNRVGPRGLLQPIADGVKLLVKEDFTPAGVDKGLFTLAPLLGVVPAMIAWAIIPWGGYLQWGDEVVRVTAAPINIGVVYVLAVGSLAVYGVVVAGYASNNKYSFLGGLRATAQMLSYEIPLGVSLLIVILMTGSLRADYFVNEQSQGFWFILHHPLLALIFFTCQLAEANRTPFDLAECEQELVGGFHTEFSSMRFALFFLGEYMHVISGAAFFTLLFLGGWSLNPTPWGPDLAPVGTIWLVLAKVAVFAAKIFLMVVLIMLIRWTLPRFRFDQLMKLAWRSLIPLTVVLLIVAGFVSYAKYDGAKEWLTYLAANGFVFLAAALFGSKLPSGPPVNRRVPLAESRFSPLKG